MKNKMVLGAMAALVTLGAANAQAARDDRPGWYGGLQINRSDMGVNGGNISGALGNQGIASPAASMDKTDTNLGLRLGYRLSPYLSLEGGYTSLGSYRYNAATTAPGIDNIQGTFKARAWSIAPVGTLPLDDKWSLLGKVGLTRVTADRSASSTTGATAPSSQSDTRTGMVIGGGVNYDFTSNTFATLEFDRYNRVGNAATGNGSDNVLSLGLGMRF